MAASKEANLNREEATNFIFADEYSDFESNSEEGEESEESSDNDQDSSDENNNDHEIPAHNCEEKPGLCPAPCFMLYHTLADHSRP